jgi:hypothetical protein
MLNDLFSASFTGDTTYLTSILQKITAWAFGS